MTSIAISYPGLMTPSLPEDSLRSFPEAFRVGMAARADKLREYGPNEPLLYDRTGVLVEVLDRVGAKNPVTSCDLHVLVHKAAEPVSS